MRLWKLPLPSTAGPQGYGASGEPRCGGHGPRAVLAIRGARVPQGYTTGVDVTRAVALQENKGISFLGIQTSGPHDIPGDLARRMLAMPTNPNRRSNHEILKPYWNGDDVAGRPRDRW